MSVVAGNVGDMRFRGELMLNGKTATGVRVPDEIVAPMGGDYWIGVSAEHRAGAGVAAGQLLDVEVEVDDAPREVEVPEDLATALQGDAKARAFFEGLSYTNQNSYVQWVTSAKKPETRADRVAKSVAALRDGVKR
jgi:hypothetical protein